MRTSRKLFALAGLLMAGSLACPGRLSASDMRFDLPGSFDVETEGSLVLTLQPNWVAVAESMAGTPPQPVISIVSSDGDQVLLIPLSEAALKEWIDVRDLHIALDADRKPLPREILAGDSARGSFCVLPNTPHPLAKTRIMGDLAVDALSLSFNSTFANTNRWPEAKLILESIRLEKEEPAPPETDPSSEPGAPADQP